MVHDGSVVLVLSLVTTLVSVSLVTTTSFLVAAATSLVVHTTVVVVESTVLVLVIILHLLAELLGEIVLGSNDPFFFGLNLTNNVSNIFRGFIGVLVLSMVQFSLQTCDLLSWVGAEFLPVKHLRLFTAKSLVLELLL